MCDVGKVKLVIFLAASRSSALVPAEASIHHRVTASFAALDLGIVVLFLGFAVLDLWFVVLFLGFVVLDLWFVVLDLGFVILDLGFVVLGCFNETWVT